MVGVLSLSRKLTFDVSGKYYRLSYGHSELLGRMNVGQSRSVNGPTSKNPFLLCPNRLQIKV